MKIKNVKTVDDALKGLHEGLKTGQAKIRDGRFVPLSDNAYHLCRKLMEFPGGSSHVTQDIGLWPNIP